MDWNVYYNPTQKVDQVKFNGMSFEQWKNKGKDKNSLYTDPMFVDPDKYDFRLKENSPAFDLGFKQIDSSKAGPREKAGLQ